MTHRSARVEGARRAWRGRRDNGGQGRSRGARGGAAPAAVRAAATSAPQVVSRTLIVLLLCTFHSTLVPPTDEPGTT